MNFKKALIELSISDPRIGSLINEYGPPKFNLITNYYESLVRSIVYQQLSIRAAGTIYERLISLFKSTKFPNPEEVLAISPTALRSVGLSNQKVNYIRDLSEKWYQGQLDLSNIDSMTDEQISKELIKVKGIGQWTADMFLMFTLLRPDVFPYGDLAIQKGFKIFNNMNRLPTLQEMEIKAEQWRPYRTIAAWYLWKIVDGPFEF